MQNRPLLGVASLCLGVLVFSLQDALIKEVSDRYPVTEVLAIRAVVAVPLILAVVHWEAGVRTVRTPQAALLLARAFIMFISYTSYYLAIAALPLADAVALFFTAPLFILTLAGPYLGERLSARAAAATFIGLIGVIIMLRPGAGVFEWAGLLSLVAAACYGFAQLMARRSSDKVSAAVMSFYQNAVYLVCALLTAVLVGALGIGQATHPSLDFLLRPWASPDLRDLGIMAACGVIATAGTILLAQAYRLATANAIAPFEYSAILWTPMWGFVFFGEVPQGATALGAALIVGSGLVALAGPGRRAETVSG